MPLVWKKVLKDSLLVFMQAKIFMDFDWSEVQHLAFIKVIECL